MLLKVSSIKQIQNICGEEIVVMYLDQNKKGADPITEVKE